MAFPQMALPYQQPPQTIMAPQGSSPMDNMGFYFVFATLAIALIVVAGIYGVHRFKDLY
jgi:hypothetical protein